MFTHEQFIAAVAGLALARLPEAERGPFDGVKLVYGMGETGAYGVTYFRSWKCKDDDCEHVPFVEIGARHQVGHWQLATTTLHELAHVLAGLEAGHGPDWKAACERLGLRRAKAVGMHLSASVEPSLRMAIAALPRPTDGQPITRVATLVGPRGGKPRGCTTGIGTKGGKSRGVGSGSRLRKFVCECEPPVIVRASRDELAATCNCCAGLFKRA